MNPNYPWVPNKGGWGGGLDTLDKIKLAGGEESEKADGGGGNFDKIKIKELFVNEIQF